MLIRSQNKTALVMLEDAGVIGVGESAKGTDEKTVRTSSLVLGTYRNIGDAKAVIEAIYQAYGTGVTAFQMPPKE